MKAGPASVKCAGATADCHTSPFAFGAGRVYLMWRSFSAWAGMKPTGKKKRRAQARAPSGHPAFRLNPIRQGILAVIALVAVGGSYLAASYFGGDSGPAEKAPPAPQQAWYASQPPPPTVVTAPAAPIFPEEHRPEHPHAAYEEALPAEVFVAPPPPPPPKAEADAPVEVAAIPTAPPPKSLPSWQRNAVPAPRADGRPMVAIVIDDLGMDRRRTSDVAGLPGPLTLSFLTYADDLGEQTDKARLAGHELMLHVPMEPSSRTVDPGPNVLLTTLDAAEIRRRLDWGLSRFGGYVGINNHMGSKFTADPKAMGVVMDDLSRRGLLFLDSRTGPHTVGRAEARRFGVPIVERNIFLDNENEVPAVLARLAEVEAIARKTGEAIAIGHPRDATIEALAGWLPALRDMGLVLVPISAIAMKHKGGPRLAVDKVEKDGR